MTTKCLPGQSRKIEVKGRDEKEKMEQQAEINALTAEDPSAIRARDFTSVELEGLHIVKSSSTPCLSLCGASFVFVVM